MHTAFEGGKGDSIAVEANHRHIVLVFQQKNSLADNGEPVTLDMCSRMPRNPMSGPTTRWLSGEPTRQRCRAFILSVLEACVVGRRCLALLISLVSNCLAAESRTQRPIEMDTWVVTASPFDRGEETGGYLGATAWTWKSTEGMPHSLGEAFSGIPSMVVQESFGGIEAPRFSVRGSGIQSAPTSRGIAIRWAGLPLGLADGTVQGHWIVPALASGGRLWRGADGVFSGAGAMGGAMDIDGLDFSGDDRISYEAGSHGRWSMKAVKRAAHDTWSSVGSIAAEGRAGYRSHDVQRRLFATTSVRVGRGEYSLIGGNARYDVPGPLSLAMVETSPDSVSAEVARDQPRRDSSVARLSARWSIAERNESREAGLSWQRHRDDFRQLQANGQNVSSGDDLAGNLMASRMLEHGRFTQRLVVVASGQFGWRRWERFTHGSGLRGARFADDRLAAHSASLGLMDVLTLPSDFRLRLGTTLLSSGRRSKDRSGAATGGVERDYTRLQPHATIEWRPHRIWTLHADCYRGAEAPTFDDLLPTEGRSRRIRNLNMQTADTLEAGLRGEAGFYAWNFCAYRSRWHGELLRLADAQGFALGTLNADVTLHQGLEASIQAASAEKAPRFVVEMKGVWQQARFEQDPVRGDGRLAGVPKRVGNVSLRFDCGHGWFGRLSGEGTGGVTNADHAGRLGYPGHATWSMRCGRDTRQFGWHVSVSNLFERSYVASTAGVLDIARNPQATWIFLPGAPRNWSAGMEWKF